MPALFVITQELLCNTTQGHQYYILMLFCKWCILPSLKINKLKHVLTQELTYIP